MESISEIDVEEMMKAKWRIWYTGMAANSHWKYHLLPNALDSIRVVFGMNPNAEAKLSRVENDIIVRTATFTNLEQAEKTIKLWMMFS
jgi:hypothetical protein